MSFWLSLRTLTAVLLAFLYLVPPPSLFAQTHVVTQADLQHEAVDSSARRQQSLNEVNAFFASSLGRRALKDAHISPEQVTKAVSSLDDAELAKLAARTQRAQQDFAAGSLSSHALVIIVVAIAVVLVVILATKL